MKNKNRNTAVHFAVRKGHLEIVQALLAKENLDLKEKLALNVKHRFTATSLHFSVRQGSLDIVNALLLQANLDLTIKTILLHPSLNFVVRIDYLHIVQD